MLPPNAESFRDCLLEWCEEHLREFPWRNPDASLYEVFVAEFFLTQTPAENVAAVYPEFIGEYPSLQAVEIAEVDELERVIEPLGFQQMRAQALSEIAETTEALPGDVEELQQLPRVGEYISRATICFARDQPLAIVDRNVRRVYRRVFGDAFPERPAEEEAFAAALLPEEGAKARRYNLGLLDFGASICTSQAPRCQSCFASTYCSYYQDTCT